MPNSLQFDLQIQCDNAAFEPPTTELARILRNVASQLERGENFEPGYDKIGRPLPDVNGNVVGFAKLRTVRKRDY